MVPSTATPSSNYPSLSPSTVYIITTVAGSSTSGTFSGDGAAATAAVLNGPHGIALDTSGSTTYCLYILCLSYLPPYT